MDEAYKIIIMKINIKIEFILDISNINSKYIIKNISQMSYFIITQTNPPPCEDIECNCVACIQWADIFHSLIYNDNFKLNINDTIDKYFT